jgi:excisionase family DNA binding protein
MSTAAQTPKLLTINEAASALGTTSRAIRTLIWDGQLPYVPIGKRHLIDPADLEKLVSRLKTKNKS